VKTMILHAASIAAIFVDQAQQPQCVFQCAQSASESWVKWLLPTGQTIFPVAGGVLIAWIAFRWNKNKEHEQWVRDQKKAEWRELLCSIASMRVILHPTEISHNHDAECIKLRPMAQQTLASILSAIFVRACFKNIFAG